MTMTSSATASTIVSRKPQIISPALTPKLLQHPLRVFETRDGTFVLYDADFLQLHPTSGLPKDYKIADSAEVVSKIVDSITDAADCGKEEPEEVRGDQKKKPDEELCSTPKGQKLLCDKTENAIRILANNLMGEKKRECQIFTEIKNRTLLESHLMMAKEIRDFADAEKTNKELLARVSALESDVLGQLSKSFSDALVANGKTIRHFDRPKTRNWFEKLQMYEETQVVEEKKRPPVRVGCGHMLDPEELCRCAYDLRKGMPRGPLQLSCPHDDGYILNERELANLLGKKYKSFTKKYGKEAETKPGESFCIVCGMSRKTQHMVRLHRNHVVCKKCLRNYVQRQNRLALDVKSLGSPAGFRCAPIKCPARDCEFRFGESTIKKTMQTKEYFAVLEGLLQKSMVENVEELMKRKEKSAMLGLSNYDLSSSRSWHNPAEEAKVVPKRKVECSICKDVFERETVVALMACEHYLCEGCFKVYLLHI